MRASFKRQELGGRGQAIQSLLSLITATEASFSLQCRVLIEEIVDETNCHLLHEPSACCTISSHERGPHRLLGPAPCARRNAANVIHLDASVPARHGRSPGGRPGRRGRLRAEPDRGGRRGLPGPGLQLLARRRDLPVRLFARRLYRSLARRPDPQRRHRVAGPGPRDRQPSRSTGPAPRPTSRRARTPTRSAPTTPTRPTSARTTSPGARRTGRRPTGRRPHRSDSLCRSLGHRRRHGCAGLPHVAPLLNRRHTFHDAELSSHVEAALHASRSTRDADVPAGALEQPRRAQRRGDRRARTLPARWFPGVHGAVGGGGDEDKLSSFTLDSILDGAERQGSPSSRRSGSASGRA